ncbi:hypothetical protein [Kordia sp.]|uniref:hypothetical protein n=1 Tax=Kordia sp. TaxID=1965332 RepID=UPI0025BBB70D|nr:hypothetical protein [Kordia sp.]MCH2196960.1 hypothetical protein [Kordia sp.]
MEKELIFTEFIEHICKRPAMYCLGSTFNEISAYINGYSHAKKAPISGADFNQFVCLKNSFPTNYAWYYVIKTCSKNDTEAIALMKDTILEFCDITSRMSIEQVMNYAIKNANTQKEGEPEKIFRKFDRALLSGNKAVIESLVLDIEKADVLWQGKYPNEVAEQLEELSNKQPIKRIYESENGKSIKILASGWPFPIEMIQKNGTWKINAGKIIKLRTHT